MEIALFSDLDEDLRKGPVIVLASLNVSVDLLTSPTSPLRDDGA